MNLDELLTRSAAIDPPSPDVVDRLGDQLAVAAHTDIARRAVLVRRRRIARIGSAVVGVTAAAAIVGAVASQPTAHTPSPQTKAPTQVAPHFRTVAQVINAAAAATPNLDPTASPYWKVSLRERVLGCEATNCAMQTGVYTIWNGNGRPGVVETVGDGLMSMGPTAIPAAGVALNGQSMTWQQANRRTWSADDLAAIVADGAAPGKPGRPSADWYIFKNTGDLLMDSPAGPTFRQQLWHYLATVQGVRLDGSAKDALGRTGWKLSLDVAGYGHASYLVDTTSGQLLESSVWIAGSGQKDPSITTLVSAGASTTAPTPGEPDGIDRTAPGSSVKTLKAAPGTTGGAIPLVRQ